MERTSSPASVFLSKLRQNGFKPGRVIGVKGGMQSFLIPFTPANQEALGGPELEGKRQGRRVTHGDVLTALFAQTGLHKKYDLAIEGAKPLPGMMKKAGGEALYLTIAEKTGVTPAQFLASIQRGRK